MRVFLSHPMSGLTEEQVMNIRYQALEWLTEKYARPIKLIDNYHHEDVPKDAGRIWHLGTSIRMMEQADLIIFCPGWHRAYGCKIEQYICDVYNLPYEFMPY